MKFKFTRLRRLGPARIFAIFVIGITLLMGFRSCRHRDSVAVFSTNRAYGIESGHGELGIKITGWLGKGWKVGAVSVEIDSTGWPKMFRYERQLLSLTAGTAYWVIVVAEGVVFFLLTNRRKWLRKPKSKPKKKRKKSS